MTREELQQVKQRFGIIGSNSALDRAIDVAVQVASTDLSVLVTGESGVGKERFPQIIHQNSARKHGPYIAVNCGAIPEGTIDSELFGHEKGAFTGAVSERKGYFEVADGGTIFLDEVGELPLTTQVRLLRVLEVGEFIKVGSSKIQKTNVRVVAATNLDMSKAISEGRFREDLFYRLNSVPISVPPLRDRGADVLLLFRKFAKDFAEKYRMEAIRLSPEAEVVLQHFPWPGNVRQLKNIAEQLSVLSEKRDISAETLQSFLPAVTQTTDFLPAFPGHSHSNEKSFESDREILYQVLFDMKKDMNELKKLVHGIISKGDVSQMDMSNVSNLFKDTDVSSVIHPQPTVSSSIKNNAKNIEDTEEYVEEIFSLGDVEKEMIKKALERHNNRRKLAAQDLKISERTLYRKIKEYGLD
ncbi:MAG: sigma-54-dependent Fis family transcriptional regulator [Paludibacteraceae bacterium]|nr:sigma-54-dependent Fis family transcriptional regulator [Paludibacteraceae bacterium]MBR4839275.1 sigma-54-dependent Fis family transcriptional regulator [Paludibacteraceae bacterium]